MGDFIPAHQAVLDTILLGRDGVHAGKMFGYPAYYAGKRLCVCLYDEGVAIKLPAASAQRLLDRDANAIPFRPMGQRAMREWVQINLRRSSGYRKYAHVFDESVRYVTSIEKANR